MRALPALLFAACTAPAADTPATRQGPGEQGEDGGGEDGGGEAGGTTTGSDGDGGTQDTAGPTGPVELRGIWVTRWSWSTAADIDSIMDQVAAGGFNAVFFQIRGNFDAYYDSPYEPWASRLAGTLGQDPGWDPLASAVESAHAHGLQLHAYMNAFPFWSGTSAPASVGVAHPYELHPDWTVADTSGEGMALNSSYIFAAPGAPEVQAHIAKVAGDIADRYAVDGIHLDYVRFPGSQYSHDAASVAAYAASGGGLSWEDWERQQVIAAVQAVRARIDLPLTAAVWGIYENSYGWSGVSQGNIDYYQDSWAFLEEGATDANIPMIYWPVTPTEGDRLDFRTLVRDHVAHSYGRHLYAGMGAEGVSYEELVDCVKAAREEGAQGVVVFDWSLFSSRMADFKIDVFAEPAAIPTMDWR